MEHITISISCVDEDRYLLVVEHPPAPGYQGKPRYYFTTEGLTKLREELLKPHNAQFGDAPGFHWEVGLDRFAMESHAPEATIALPQDLRDKLIQDIARLLLEPVEIQPDPFE